MSPPVFILLFGAAIVATVIALVWIYRSSSRAPSAPADDDLVIIATGGEAELSIMAARLEGAGLKGLTRDRTTSVYPTGLGWELLVLYSDQRAARRILKLD